MAQRRLWVGFVFVSVLFAAPRTGDAGIGEWLWEMSGPPLIGGGIECKFSLNGTLERCYVTLPPPVRSLAQERRPRFRYSLEGSVYASYPGTIEGVSYDWGQVWMVFVDPMLEYVSWTSRTDAAGQEEYAIYHGVIGGSYNIAKGRDFRAVGNGAIKIRPLGVKIKRAIVEYNMRFYPDGFNGADFNAAPPQAGTPEIVHSISFGWEIKKKPK